MHLYNDGVCVIPGCTIGRTDGISVYVSEWESVIIHTGVWNPGGDEESLVTHKTI